MVLVVAGGWGRVGFMSAGDQEWPRRRIESRRDFGK
jgi:hypothetical protein